MTRVPICPSCIHFKDNSDKLVCDAFPNGIPEEIFWIKADESGKVHFKDEFKFVDVDKK